MRDRRKERMERERKKEQRGTEKKRKKERILRANKGPKRERRHGIREKNVRVIERRGKKRGEGGGGEGEEGNEA